MYWSISSKTNVLASSSPLAGSSVAITFRTYYAFITPPQKGHNNIITVFVTLFVTMCLQQCVCTNTHTYSDGVAHANAVRAAVDEELNEWAEGFVQVAPKDLVWGRVVVLDHLLKGDQHGDAPCIAADELAFGIFQSKGKNRGVDFGLEVVGCN